VRIPGNSPTRAAASIRSALAARAAWIALAAMLLLTATTAHGAHGRWDTRGPAWTTWWRGEHAAILASHPRSRYERRLDAPSHARVLAMLESLRLNRDQPDLLARILVARARAVLVDDGKSGAAICAEARERLESKSAVVGAAARIALGLAGGPLEAELLSAHALGTESPMSSSMRAPEIEELYRAHAAYALGVHGARTESPSRAAYVVSSLKSVLHAEGSSALTRRAAILGLAIAPARELSSELVHSQALAVLLHVAEDTERPADERGLAAGAIPNHATVLDARTRKMAIERMLVLLDEKAREPVLVQAGVTTALGGMVDLGDEGHDSTARQLLWRLVANGAADVRPPAILALARIASGDGVDDGERGDKRPIRERLLLGLEKGRPELRPWFGLALARLECDLAAREDGVEKRRHATRLLLESGLVDARLPEHVGAWSIAIGILGSMDSATLVRGLLDKTVDIDARGHVAAALGLLGQPADFGPLLAQLATDRTPLDGGASFAVGLGVLATTEFLPRLVTARSAELAPWAADALAHAVARVGDAKAIEALAIWAGDLEAPSDRRAAAVHALGRLADAKRDRWQASAGACTAVLRGTELGVGSIGLLDHD